MAEPFSVNLVAVEKPVWSGQADRVIARTVEGELAVLAGHAPLLGQLRNPSRVRIRLTSGEELAYDVAGGFFSVSDEGVTILAEQARPAEGPDPAASIASGEGSARPGGAAPWADERH